MIPSGATSPSRTAVGFCHGYGFPKRYGVIDYWGEIPGLFEEAGYAVEAFRVDAFGTVTMNGRSLADQVADLVHRAGSEKVVLIGHSRGGIEAALAAADPRLLGKVSLVIAVNTPLWGTAAARRIRRKYIDTAGFPYREMNRLGKRLGDGRPDAAHALDELSRVWVEDIRNLKEIAGFRYVLFHAELSEGELPPLWKMILPLTYRGEGVGDGLVDYPENPEAPGLEIVDLVGFGFPGTTHWSLTGLPRAVRGPKIRARKFYRKLMEDYMAPPVARNEEKGSP